MNYQNQYMLDQFEIWKRTLEIKEPLIILLFPLANRYQPQQFSNWLQEKYHQKSIVMDLKSTELEDLDAWEKTLGNQNDKLIILTSAENLIYSKNNLIFKQIDQLKTTRSNGIIMFMEILPSIYTQYIKNLSYTYLFNFTFHRLYTESETTAFIHYYQRVWKHSFKPITTKQIYDLVGGNLHLVKEILRQLYYEVNKSLDAVIKSPAIEFKLHLIEEALGHTAIGALQKTIHHRNLEENNIVNDLGQFNFINVDEQLPIIWKKRLSNQSNSFLNLTQQSFTYRGVDITAHFSKAERSILIALSTNLNTTITREVLADKYWQDDSTKYSDWALDQVIYRIRKKITKLGLPIQITTKRGRGYELS